MRPMPAAVCMLAAFLAGSSGLLAQQPPHPKHRLYDLGDFRLESGAVLPAAKVLYVTAGQLDSARDNAVLVPSYARAGTITGTTSCSGAARVSTRRATTLS